MLWYKNNSWVKFLYMHLHLCLWILFPYGEFLEVLHGILENLEIFPNLFFNSIYPTINEIGD